MGQSASNPKNGDNGDDGHPFQTVIKKDLSELDDDELQKLLEDRPLEMEEIRSVARSIKLQQQSQPATTTRTTTTITQNTKSLSGFYEHEMDSSEIQLAWRLNKFSPLLAKIRFQLVPSRVKEPIFWEATFRLLNERLAEQNAEKELQQAHSTNNGNGRLTNGKHKSNHSSSTMDGIADEEVDLLDEIDLDGQSSNNNHVNTSALQQQLALRNSQVLVLRQQVKELKEELARCKEVQKEEQQVLRHKGQWIMSQDSKDFLEYPEELKTNMRREKQKRLRQVHNDMKFILDSDNVEDSNGYWDCCGAQKYNHPTCAMCN